MGGGSGDFLWVFGRRKAEGIAAPGRDLDSGRNRKMIVGLS